MPTPRYLTPAELAALTGQALKQAEAQYLQMRLRRIQAEVDEQAAELALCKQEAETVALRLGGQPVPVPREGELGSNLVAQVAPVPANSSAATRDDAAAPSTALAAAASNGTAR